MLKSYKYTLPEEMIRELVISFLKPYPGESILDINCGEGRLIETYLKLKLNTTGTDPSSLMLEEAKLNLGHKADFFKAHAEDLPFEDNSFNYSSLFNTLELADDPKKALEEAFRVTKDKVFIAVFNRYAMEGLHKRVQAFFGQGNYAGLRFFSLQELQKLSYELAGDIPLKWRFLYIKPDFLNFEKELKLSKYLPFGTLIIVVVTLKPRFRLRPLSLSYNTASQYKKSISGLAAKTKRYKQDK